jgi:uncharacterized protein (TIGR03067 family)
MRCLRNGALLFALLAGTAPAGADQPADEVSRLAGKWVATSATYNGMPLSGGQAGQCVLTITPGEPMRLAGPQLRLSVPDKLVGYKVWSSDDKLETRYTTSWEGYSLGLDASSTPHIITGWKLAGLKGTHFGGIYRLEGETLTVCFNLDRYGKPPKEFASPRGSNVLLLTLRRGK